MYGPVWLVSYLVLWLVVILLVLLTVGILRALGDIRGKAPTAAKPELVDTMGPDPGSVIPSVLIEDVRGNRTVQLGPTWPGLPAILCFVSPGCTPCAIALLNLSKARDWRGVALVVAVHGDKVAASNFIDAFSLKAIVTPDANGYLAKRFAVKGEPFALAYDRTGVLRAKSLLTKGEEDISRLLDTASTYSPELDPRRGRSDGGPSDADIGGTTLTSTQQ